MSYDSTASEKAIEDILAQSPHILGPLLDEEPEALVPVARQQSISTGRTDLVYLVGSDVILIELKVTEASTDHINQLLDYVDSYNDTESQPAFAAERELRPVLMAPNIPSDIWDTCIGEGIDPVEFDMKTVLNEYQETLFSGLAQFQVTGTVTSVARLGLMNKYLKFVYDSTGPVTLEEAAKRYDQIGKGESNAPLDRIRNFRRSAAGLALLNPKNDGLTLTERGERYVEAGDFGQRPWQVTIDQANIVVDLLFDDPFYSDLTYSLIALVDSVFELSKNTHPVPRDQLKDWYTSKVGKDLSWGDRTRTDVVRWLGSSLEELGLASVIDRQFYLTPEGFTLLSHVSIDEGKAMIRSQR